MSRARDARERHPALQLLIACSPLSLVLVAYWTAQWISAPLDDGEPTNRLGFAVHVAGPTRLGDWLFGEVPTVWLQERLVDGSPHWYDALAALVYVTHFLTPPLVTGLVWFLARDRFREWVLSLLTLVLLGTTGYVVYPAAPPWLAAQRGEIGPVERISDLGWEWLHLDWIGFLTVSGQSGSNPVAAMPSLHAAVAFLIALFAWPAVGWLARTALLAYAVAMALTLVYTGEHYLSDIAVGWALAAVGALVGAWAQRRWPPRTDAGGVSRSADRPAARAR